MEPVKEKSNTINVLGRSPDQEDAEPILLTALREAGFQLRMLAPKSDLQDFIAAPDAKLNLVLSPFMNPLAEWMHKHHNVPFISLHGAYKVSEIECVYLQICELLNIEWEESFEEGKKEAELLEKKAEAFQGMDYAITQMGAIDPLPLALYFADFQMRPILIHVEEFYPEDKNWRDKIVEKGYDPVICHMVNDRDDRAVLEYLCPDFYIGELELSKILGISLVQDLYGKCGYERTALLLRRMLSAYGGE